MLAHACISDHRARTDPWTRGPRALIMIRFRSPEHLASTVVAIPFQSNTAMSCLGHAAILFTSLCVLARVVPWVFRISRWRHFFCVRQRSLGHTAMLSTSTTTNRKTHILNLSQHHRPLDADHYHQNNHCGRTRTSSLAHPSNVFVPNVSRMCLVATLTD